MIYFAALPKSNYFKLTAEVSHKDYIAPIGFITNLANIPWQLQLFIACYDYRIRRAAIIHDWLYTTQLVSRLDADKILCEIMREDGADELMIKAAYFCVMVFGAKNYGAKSA
jgi:hypothetical protein